MIEEEDEAASSGLHFAKLDERGGMQTRVRYSRPLRQDRFERMHGDRVLIILLPRKTAEDDGGAFLVTVFPGDGSSVRELRHSMRGLVLDLELLLELHGFEVRISPRDFEFLAGN